MVPIPYAMSYTSTAAGRVPKFVRCEQCGFEYVYLLEATSSGQATSLLFLDNAGARARSDKAAQVALRQTLESEVSVVPCSQCGHVHSSMIARARQLHYSWMKTAGLVLLFGGVFLFPASIHAAFNIELHGVTFGAIAIWTLAIVLFTIGVAAITVRSIASANYDPNSLPEDTRKRLGAELAVSRVEFEKLLRDSTVAPEKDNNRT